MPGREDDDRHVGPAAQAADDLDAVHAGQPEVEDDDVRVVARGELQRLLAGRRRGRRRTPARGGSRRARGRICGSSSTTSTRVMRAPPRQARVTTVSPPPGVSSTSTSPPIASTNPRATARPRPTPLAGRRVAEPLERPEHRARGLRAARRGLGRRRGGRPIPPAGPAVEPDRCAAAVPDGVGDDVRERPLEQARVRVDPGEVAGHVDDDAVGGLADAPQRGRNDLLEPDRQRVDVERPGLQPATCRGGSRPAHRVDRRPRRLSRRNASVSSGPQATSSAQKRRHRRLDPRQGGAKVVRHRGQERCAKLVRSGERVDGRDAGLELGDVERGGDLRGRRP